MSYEQNTLLYKYNYLLSTGKLNKDVGQAMAVEELNNLYLSLLSNIKKKWQFWSSSVAPKGVYLFGGVGRGKTMLMDLFFAECPEGNKQRLHFHDFMLHQEMKSYSADVYFTYKSVCVMCVWEHKSFLQRSRKCPGDIRRTSM